MSSIFDQDVINMERDALFRKSSDEWKVKPILQYVDPAELEKAIQQEMAELLGEVESVVPPVLQGSPPCVAPPIVPPTPVGDQITSTPGKKPAYRFSSVPYPLDAWSTSTSVLVSRLNTLCNEWDAARGCKQPYTEIREEVCAIGLELNRRGDFAPRFRPRRNIRPARRGVYDAMDALLLNDLQVIDLHWLHCRQVRLSFANEKWTRLAAAEEFDFVLAAEFAAVAGSPNNKVEEIMEFNDVHQLELAILQSDGLRKLWQVLQKGRDDAGGTARGTREVRKSLERVPSLQRHGSTWIEMRVLLWVCDRLAGSVNGSAQQLASLYALATGGTPQDPSNLRRMVKSLERHLK